jgi:outer membrane protein assembly factor BamB
VQGVVLAVSPSRAHGFDGATGRLLWTYDAPLSPWGASLLGGPGGQSWIGNSYTDADGETLYVPAWGGNISALDARTGTRRWLWQFDPDQPNVSMAMGVRVSGDTLYAIVTSWTTQYGIRTDPFLFAISTRSGHELWRLALPDTASGSNPWAQPVLAGGLVVVTGGKRLFGVDPLTQTIRWTFVGPETGQVARYSPVTRDGMVYLDNVAATMSALDGATGRELWRTRLAISESGYPGDCATNADLAVSERYLYVPCQLWIMTLDRFTGRIVAIRNVPKTHPGHEGVQGHVRSGLLTARGLAVALIANSRGSSSTWYAAAFREP